MKKQICRRESKIMKYRVCFTIKRRIIGVLLNIILVVGSAFGAVLESCDDGMTQARACEFIHSRGGPAHNKLTEVSDPVRGGLIAFRHWIDQRGERSELAMMSAFLPDRASIRARLKTSTFSGVGRPTTMGTKAQSGQTRLRKGNWIIWLKGSMN